MSEDNPKNVEIEPLSDDDLESVSGGGGNFNAAFAAENTGSGTCDSRGTGSCTNSGTGTCLG